MKRERKESFRKRATFFRFAKLKKRTRPKFASEIFVILPRASQHQTLLGGNNFCRHGARLQGGKFRQSFTNKAMEPPRRCDGEPMSRGETIFWKGVSPLNPTD